MDTGEWIAIRMTTEGRIATRMTTEGRIAIRMTTEDRTTGITRENRIITRNRDPATSGVLIPRSTTLEGLLNRFEMTWAAGTRGQTKIMTMRCLEAPLV